MWPRYVVKCDSNHFFFLKTLGSSVWSSELWGIFMYISPEFGLVNVGKQLLGTACTMFQTKGQPCKFCVALSGTVVIET